MAKHFDTDCSVAVIGAGPHGLAAAAHLRFAGIESCSFGEPLGFWREAMPAGMRLRSSSMASSISDPAGRLSLARWSEEHGHELEPALSLAEFLDYGEWFQRQAVPELDTRRVVQLERRGSSFALTLSDGDTLSAERVLVAAGLSPFAFTPPVFRDLPGSLVQHSSQSIQLDAWGGRSVLVVGAGQSALEAAALLSEAGADVEVLVRGPAVLWLGGYGWGGIDEKPVLPPPKGPSAAPSTWRARNGLYWHSAPTEVGGRFSSWLGAAPDLCRLLPGDPRARLTEFCVRAAGANWLPDRLRAVKISVKSNVKSARVHGQQVQLMLEDGSERTADHVLLGTGYQVDVRSYEFLSGDLRGELRVRHGYPMLRRGLESSIPGLHFTGAAATWSFGPAMRFVVGTAYTGPALTQRIQDRRRPYFRWAF